jgi:hypothetical protein
VIVVERFFYAVTWAHCSGMFIVFGSPLAAIRGQGHSVSRGPKRCALRCDRPTQKRLLESVAIGHAERLVDLNEVREELSRALPEGFQNLSVVVLEKK